MGPPKADAEGYTIRLPPQGALDGMTPSQFTGTTQEDREDSRGPSCSARPGWRLVETVCPYCGAGCRLRLRVRGTRLSGVEGGDGPPNHGWLCLKGRLGWDFAHHPDRLTVPLVRKGGLLTETSWAEALDLVAARLSELVRVSGAGAVAGLASGKCTNEENFVFQKLMRAGLGTNNIDQCGRLCHAASVAGLTAAFGAGAMTNSIDELASADLIFIIGANPTVAHPLIAARIEEACSRGARLICADPRSIEIARLADLRLQHLPGTDAALLNAMMHVILEEGLADERFIAGRTENFEAFQAVVRRYPPELAEVVSGVPAAKIREAAILYAQAPRSSIVYSSGLTQHTTGLANVLSVANLAMLTGNVGRESTGVNPLLGQVNAQGACDMGALPDVFPGYQPVCVPASRERYEAASGCQLPGQPGLTMTEILAAAARGEVKGLFVLGANPALSAPDLKHTTHALRRLEFLVVQDIFLTETAELAHVVLPGASFVEKDGTVTSTERRVQRIRRAVPPAGSARSDLDILLDLADRLGLGPGPGGPDEVMNEIARMVPDYGGLSYRRLDTSPAGIQWPCPTPDHPGTRYLHRYGFSGGRAPFSPVDYQGPAEHPDEDYPLILTTGCVLEHSQTGTMSRRSTGLGGLLQGAGVELNPLLAAEMGVSDGDPVRVVSRRGAVVARAILSLSVGREMVFLPYHFREASANLLTNPAFDPGAKTPELKVAAVRIERLDAATISALAAAGAHEKAPAG